ncbi:MAG: hypothetical protein M3547_01045 [Acidobacteriota bacterium]|nr:hypothetical protein [Acidobacteriota bacterium]
MSEPRLRIEFSIAPYILSYGNEGVYAGRKIVWPAQFGFFRADVDTGAVETRVTVGYLQPVFPTPIAGHYVPGDDNQTVTRLAASPDWIVTNVHGSGKLLGPTGAPTVDDPKGGQAAFVFRNDVALTFHGIVYAKSGYYWDWQAGAPVIVGDALYVPDDRGGWAFIDLAAKQWRDHVSSPPPDTSQKSIDGFTYTLRNEGDAWAGGIFHSVPYVFTRSDVPVVSEPLPAPAPSPTPSPAPPQPAPQPSSPATPAEGEPPMSPVDYPGAPPLGPDDQPGPNDPCPPGYYRALVGPDAGKCVPSAPVKPPPDSSSDGVRMGEYDVTCEFTGRVKGQATAVLFEDVGLFRLPATGKIEVVVKRADVPRPNFFFGTMTDVGFTAKVRNRDTGEEKSYVRPEGAGVEGLVSF